MINWIWLILIVLGLIIAICTGNIVELSNVILSTPSDTFNIFLKMALLILFWGGIFNIAIESGLIKNLTKALKKPLLFIFPELHEDDVAMEYICSNIIANLLGLGAAATPLGLKAFKELQKLNKKDTPSRSMITFILLNASSITLFPTTIIGIRHSFNGHTSLSLVGLMILATIVSTMFAVILDRLIYLGKKKK